MIGRLLTIAFAASGLALAQSAERFALRLPTLSGPVFERGGLIRLPATEGRIKEIELRIVSPRASRIPPGSVVVEINKTPQEAIVRSIDANTLVATITAQPDDPDLFPPGRINRLEVRIRNSADYANSWTVERTTDIFLTQTVGDDDGVPLEVKLQMPRPPVLLPSGRAQSLTVSGSVNRTNAQVSINGQEVALKQLPGGLRSEFLASVSIPADAVALIVNASGTKQDVALLVLPIRRSRQ